MSQEEIVKKAIAEKQLSIKEVVQETKILEPNIRRILGQGVKKGVFRRISRGIYTVVTETGEQRAYIKAGAAQEELPKMVAQGRKFDMVFLDPAYYSRSLIGGNRGIKKWNFINVEDFKIVMRCIALMMKTSRSHVYLMLSGARTAQPDMEKYLEAGIQAGFKVVAEGKYQKTFANGKPVTNVRGEEASSERLILLTKSGKALSVNLPELQMDFKVQRPAIKGGYQTEKSPLLIDQLILQSTWENDETADFFAGSGVFVERALLSNRKVTAVEISEEAVNNFIIPKIENLYGNYSNSSNS